MKVNAVVILFFSLAIFCGAQTINDIVALNNGTEISVEPVTEPQYFYYSTLGTNGLVRIYITNDGTVDIVAHLQQCYLPFQPYFTFGDDKDFIDECTAHPGTQCELVVRACNFDPSSRYYIKVDSAPEGESFSHKIKAVEEDFSNTLTMRNGAYYTNSHNTLYKYPYKSYKFEIPESNDAIVDVFVKHQGDDGKLNFFISANKTGDLECSILNVTNFGPGEHHFRLTRECLENYTSSETFFLSIVAVNEGYHNIPFEARIYSQEKGPKYEKIDKEIAIREFLSDPYRSSYFEVDLRKDKNNTITTFTLNHPYEGVTSTSRLIVSDEEDPNDLCLNSTYSCTFSGDDGCKIELESCKREERQYFFLSTVPIHTNLTKVPLTLGYSVKEYPIETLSDEYYRDAPSEWSFFELDTQNDFYSSNIIDIEIQPEETDLLEVHVTRGGITKGGSCADEKFICNGKTICKGSFALCDFDYNGTSIYLSIRSLPAFSSKYLLRVSEKETPYIAFDSPVESSISPYEAHTYVINEQDEKFIPGMAILEYIEQASANELILSVIAANESGCPVQSTCKVNSVDTICRIPLICLGESQQPYLKVTTDKADEAYAKYKLTLSYMNEESLTNGQSVTFTTTNEKWFFVEEEYDVNVRYTVEITEGNAQVDMYRDCVEIHNKLCEEDTECNLFANRNDKAYGGTYWLRVRPETGSTSTSGKVGLSLGVQNCKNITSEFCGPMFADIVDIIVTDNDLLAKESYEALELTLSSEICSSVKEYVCGINFPVCGEFGVAPAICRESCIEAFNECAITSTCPYEFCERLPDCPIPPEEDKFYSGYIALIIIYSILAAGLIFSTIVIIIKKE